MINGGDSPPPVPQFDWFTRRVLSWRVSTTLEAAFCIEALQEALARFGKPEIFNTGQGSQFTVSAVYPHWISGFATIAEERVCS